LISPDDVSADVGYSLNLRFWLN